MPALRRFIAAALASLCTGAAFPILLPAQDPAPPKRFAFSAYAALNYLHFDWDTEADRRAVIDLERLVVEGVYTPSRKVSFEAEVEFEHGGSGSSVEFEDGEFETEVEKGGEIVVEELHATFALKDWLDLRVGHFYVPVGFLSSKYQPFEYPTVVRPAMETSLLPAQWDETGLKLMARHRAFRGQLGVVNGLDNSEFNSSTWIRRGKQRRFEEVRAENLAAVGRLDLLPLPGLVAGVSGYIGNTSGNRPANDLKLNGYVKIAEVHADYERNGWRARAMGVRGWLQNSAAISAANRLIEADHTPVAAGAAGVSFEAGYDILRLFGPRAPEAGRGLDLFGRWEWFDSMYRVAPGEVDDPQYERRQWTVGLNYFLTENLVLKGEYADRKIGKGDTHDRTIATGLGAWF
jgi:hypothetical protein